MKPFYKSIVIVLGVLGCLVLLEFLITTVLFLIDLTPHKVYSKTISGDRIEVLMSDPGAIARSRMIIRINGERITLDQPCYSFEKIDSVQKRRDTLVVYYQLTDGECDSLNCTIPAK